MFPPKIQKNRTFLRIIPRKLTFGDYRHTTSGRPRGEVSEKIYIFLDKNGQFFFRSERICITIPNFVRFGKKLDLKTLRLILTQNGRYHTTLAHTDLRDSTSGHTLSHPPLFILNRPLGMVFFSSSENWYLPVRIPPPKGE